MLAKITLNCGTAKDVTLARKEAITLRHKPVIKIV
jgi:hypothetical protein